MSQLPLDGIKIDYGFVRDMLISPAARAVVAATIELAEVLGLEVVAEGVETEEQAEAHASNSKRCGARSGRRSRRRW